MSKRVPIKWSQIRKRLSALPIEEHLDLFKELFDLSPQNQQYLAEKLNPQGKYESVWEEYGDRVIDPFSGSKRVGKGAVQKAREAIQEYQQAFPEDLEGIVELMLTFVEGGTERTVERGEMYAGAYDEVEAVLVEMEKLVKAAKGAFHLDEGNEGRFIRLAELASQLDWQTEHRVQDLVAEVLGHRRWRG